MDDNNIQQEVWIYDGLEEIGLMAEKLLDYAGPLRVWLFEGELGAGKTTFIKELCDKLNVEDNVSSPTFALINEYETTEGELVYHFDLYRIKSEEEALDIGISEYFDTNYYCFIEWPSKIPHLIPNEHLKIEIQSLSNSKRQLVITRNE